MTEPTPPTDPRDGPFDPEPSGYGLTLFPNVNPIITYVFIAVLAVAIGVCAWLLVSDDGTAVEESGKVVLSQQYEGQHKDVGHSNLTKGN